MPMCIDPLQARIEAAEVARTTEAAAAEARAAAAATEMGQLAALVAELKEQVQRRYLTPPYIPLHPLTPRVHPLQAEAAHAGAAADKARNVELEQKLAQQVRQQEARLQLRATSRYMHPLTSITLLLTLHPRA